MSRGVFIFAERRTAAGTWERAEPVIPNPRWQDEDWLRVARKYPAHAEAEPEWIREPLLSWWWKLGPLHDVLTYGVTARDVNTGETRCLLAPVVAAPRGLPADLTEETRALYDTFSTRTGPLPAAAPTPRRVS